MSAPSEAISQSSETFASRMKEDWRQYVIYAGFCTHLYLFLGNTKR